MKPTTREWWKGDRPHQQQRREAYLRRPVVVTAIGATIQTAVAWLFLGRPSEFLAIAAIAAASVAFFSAVTWAGLRKVARDGGEGADDTRP